MNKLKKIILPMISTAAIAAPVVVTISCNSNSSVLFQGRRTLVSYSSEESYSNQRQRVWDLTVQANDVTSRDYYYMTNANLFREKVVENSVVKSGQKGNLTETKEKEEELIFDGIDSVTLKDSSSSKNGIKYKNPEKMMEALRDSKNEFNEMIVTVPKETNYVNSNGKKTKYNFKAIDYFYGMMRSLYTSKEIRENNTISGIKTGLPKMEPAYVEKIKNDQEFYPGGILDSVNFDNGNVYLYNLFGFDLKETFKANTGKNANPDQFVVKFNNKITPDIIYSAFTGSSFINPVSSEKINEITGQNYKDPINEPGSRFAILEYGKSPIKNSKADLSKMLTVSRYYWKQYDLKTTKDEGTGLILEKNMNTYDKNFAKNNKNILKYQILIHGKGDKDTFHKSRQKSFLEANNSESLMYTDILKNPALMKEITADPKYLSIRRSSLSGAINQGTVNPYYYLTGKDKIGDNESLLLFGSKLKEAKTDPGADEEYFNGRGRQFRTLLNNSVNLYSLTKEYYAGSALIKTNRNYNPNQPIVGGKVGEENTFGKNQDIGVSVFSTPDRESRDWYSNNAGSKIEALKPTNKKFEKLKELWKDFAVKTRDEVKELKENATFTFPLYDFRANDVPEEKAISKTFKTLVAYLKTITKGSGISFREFDKKAGSKKENGIANPKSAPFLYTGAGADYSSVISLVQQYISASYGYGIGVQILTAALNNKLSDNNYNIKDFKDAINVKDYSISLNENVDISDIFTFITDNNKKFPTLAKEIKGEGNILSKFTMEDWHKFKSHTFDDNKDDKETKKLLNEVDNLFQKYMFSISTEKDKIEKWTNLLANYNMPNKLAIGYTSYTSLATELGSKMPITKIYSQPWLHFAASPSHSIAQRNIVDTWVDEVD